MKSITCLLILACLLDISFSFSQVKSVTRQPNIVFILGDDISAEDIGCYGNKSIRTPNIDKIAKEGIRFTNMYVTASSCSPSRTSIITGRYPHNTGSPELHLPLPGHLAVFPELLQKAGYYTAQLGKWHEGPETLRAYDTLLTGVEINGDGGEDQWINILKGRPKDKPFFFWLAPFDAHREWGADRFRQPYQPSEVSIPPTLVDTKETRKDLASYYNEISRIDFYLGELEKELSRQGILENTIIIFMGDNARPFPGSKTRLYDRGLNTPFLIKWPAGISAKNLVCKSLVSAVDIAPTLLRLGGAETSPDIQGVSFRALLQNPGLSFRNFIFGEHNWHDYEAYERSIRTRDYLYILNRRPQFDNSGPIDANQSPSAKSLVNAKKTQKLTALQNDIFLKPRPAEEFYALKNDKFQVRNRINDKNLSKEISRLKSVLKRWRAETGDTEPSVITPDWYDRLDGSPLPAKGKRGEVPGAAGKAAYLNSRGPF